MFLLLHFYLTKNRAPLHTERGSALIGEADERPASPPAPVEVIRA